MPNKKEILADVFREFGNKGVLDADGVDKAIEELNESSASGIDVLYEILVFTLDNKS